MPDFDEKHNVFSYVYSTKVHKSHALRARNEKVVNIMKEQFMSPPRSTLDEKILLKDRRERDAKDENNLAERNRIRKQKEMETKLFQDQQVQAKLDVKKLREA